MSGWSCWRECGIKTRTRTVLSLWISLQRSRRPYSVACILLPPPELKKYGHAGRGRPDAPLMVKFRARTQSFYRASISAATEIGSSVRQRISFSLPFSSISRRSQSRIVFNRCAITKAVRPSITWCSESSNSDSVAASRALVGSSSIRIGAFFRKARAIDSLCLWPPDRRDPPSPILVS